MVVIRQYTLYYKNDRGLTPGFGTSPYRHTQTNVSVRY
ncbi:hypothetical protein A343_1937 [Porphyromonas gingivalis JCVI SC001]|nr:hypothetical protein A343_1937 [Porphyromonas gingivalis JCVI SC001]